MRFDGLITAANPIVSPASAAVLGSRLSIARSVKTAETRMQTVPA